MFIAAAFIASSLLTQSLPTTGTAAAKPIGKAVFEETTGSYFQIFEFSGRPPYTWQHAELMVTGYLHEGRVGQLAKIPSADVHYFLLGTFPLVTKTKLWFGLQAVCRRTAELEWVDGSPISDNTFRAWGDTAQQSISRTCRAGSSVGTKIPIYYNADKYGVRWEAGTRRTNINHMIVEFTAPKTDTDTDTGADTDAGTAGQNIQP